MSNHFHLVIETPQPNLVAGMKRLLGTYTSRYNRRHNGEAVQEAKAAQAERLAVQGLNGWAGARPSFGRGARASPGRFALARELRAKTTMPLAWIAERLSMGSRGHLAWLLQQCGASRLAAPTDQGLLRI